jgi:NitT/TauT family transport system substrate-binding protein
MKNSPIKVGAIALTCALAVSSCGGSDDDSAKENSVRVVETGQYNLSLIGADAADAFKTYADHDLEVDLTVSEDVAPALASGDADIAIGSPNRFIGAIKQGLDAKIIGPTTDLWAQFVVVGEDDPAQDLDSWEGGKIGISSFGSAGHYSALKVAEALGWDKSDYEIVPVGGIDELKAALRSGTIDGFAWAAQQAYALEEEGAGRVIGSVGDLIGPMPTDVLVASADAIKNKSDEVKRFCDSYYEASQKVKDDAAAAEQMFKDWDAELAPNVLDVSAPIISTSSEISGEMFDNMADSTNLTIDGVEVTGDEVEDMYTDCSSL